MHYIYESAIQIITFSISIILFVLHFNTSLVLLTLKDQNYFISLHIVKAKKQCPLLLSELQIIYTNC